MAFDREQAFKSIIGMGASKAAETDTKTETAGMSKGVIPKGRPKSTSEIKQRISLAVYPSLYEKVKKIAFVERKTVSEVIDNLLVEYVKEHEAELDQYDKL